MNLNSRKAITLVESFTWIWYSLGLSHYLQIYKSVIWSNKRIWVFSMWDVFSCNFLFPLFSCFGCHWSLWRWKKNGSGLTVFSFYFSFLGEKSYHLLFVVLFFSRDGLWEQLVKYCIIIVCSLLHIFFQYLLFIYLLNFQKHNLS